jgi:hypothetical protein
MKPVGTARFGFAMQTQVTVGSNAFLVGSYLVLILAAKYT